MSARWTSFALLSLLAPSLVLVAGCSKKEGSARDGGPRGVAVSAGTAERRDVPIELEVIGSVEPVNSVSIQAQLDGELVQVGFAEGEDVHQGDILFVIDPRPYQAALAQAEANLARDAAQATSASANARRYADLVEKDYVTRQQADDAAAAAEAAAATLRADSAAVEKARLNLQYCTIRAPISGRTGSLLLHQGNLVKANGGPLVVIHQLVPARVAFSVPEQRLPEIRRRQTEGDLSVEASLSGDTEQVFRGTLTFVDNAVNESTGTVLLKATFPNEDRALWPGQFTNVKLRLGTLPNAVVVPSTAVQPGQQGDFVFVIGADQKVEMRPVVAGAQLNGETTIRQGLDGGEQVVTDGQIRLVPGARVEIKPAVGSPAQRGPAQTGPPQADAP